MQVSWGRIMSIMAFTNSSSGMLLSMGPYVMCPTAGNIGYCEIELGNLLDENLGGTGYTLNFSLGGFCGQSRVYSEIRYTGR